MRAARHHDHGNVRVAAGVGGFGLYLNNTDVDFSSGVGEVNVIGSEVTGDLSTTAAYFTTCTTASWTGRCPC